MKFIFKKNTRNLSFVKNLSAISYQLSAFRKLSAKSYQLKAVRGFTLVETLVAISILMVAVASPLTITQKGLASAIYAKDQIIASYLAQDAIEYLRNVSDRNVASGAPGGWLDGIINNCGTFCKVDTRQNSGGITVCGGNCGALNYNDSTNIYNHDSVGGGNSPSPFTRSVTVTENVLSVEALIKVNISWTAKNTPRSLNFYTRIYNWR